jgi:hypothetical protein
VEPRGLASLVALGLYVAVNRVAGRMAATAATFFFVAAADSVGSLLLIARAVVAAALGAGASLCWQWAEAHHLIPWARRRGLAILLSGRASVAIWSSTLFVVTLAGLGVARYLAPRR